MTFVLAIIGIVLIGLEIFTSSTFLVFIGVGFIAASLVSLLTTNLIIISVVGVLVTLVSIGLLRKKYAHYMQPKAHTQTSYNELIGKHAIMLEDYTANGVDIGLVRVTGIDWSVQCETLGLSFKEGESVIIQKIEGARLIIDKEE